MGKRSHIIICLIFLIQGFWLDAQSFENVSAAKGVNFTSSALNGWGSGVSFYDFNQDGWDDLSLVKENGPQGFYVNNQGTYQPSNFILSNFGETKQLLWVDYDNDGVLDVFITTLNGKNQLYKNDGNFGFTNVTASAGLFTGSAKNYGAAFGDFNKDGYLDLYLCKYDDGTGDTSDLVIVNNLYQNNGDGTFTDVSFSAGVTDGAKPTFCAVWLDYNHDSWPDLFVVNDRWPDATLFHNNGDGTFSDVTSTANISAPISNFMTATVGDYNNDQDLDIFVSNTAGGIADAPLLFDNQGNGIFTNLANPLGLLMPNTTWGGVWIDYDNDTWQDLYVATAFLNPANPWKRSYFFKNNLPFGFVEDSTVLSGNQIAASHAVARGDFNNDGYYDIAVQNESPVPAFLLENSGATNHYVKITLEGTVSNKFAIGSWIKVYVGGQVLTQYTLCGENYLGQNSQHHIFGLGQYSIIDSVVVEFPSGIVNSYYDLNVNQAYHFIEGQTFGTFNLPITDTVLCFGDSIELIAPEFQSYAWSTGDSSRSIVVSQSGLFSLTATDSMGSTFFSNLVELAVRDEVQFTEVIQNISCAGGQDGSVSIEVNNQGNPYTLTWQHGPIGDTLRNLNAGTYTFNYLDATGCSDTNTVHLTEPYPLNVQSFVLPQTDDSLGQIAVLVNGGNPPYQLFMDSIEVSATIDGLAADSYFIELYDAKDCYWSGQFEVPFQITDTATALDDRYELPLTIYPIPFENDLAIRFSSSINTSLVCELYDEMGKMLFTQTSPVFSGENNIVLLLGSNLHSGIYIMKCNSEDKLKTVLLHKK